jgi:hypothetical protein
MLTPNSLPVANGGIVFTDSDQSCLVYRGSNFQKKTRKRLEGMLAGLGLNKGPIRVDHAYG